MNIYLFLLIAQKHKLLRTHLISDHILGEKTTPKSWNTPWLFLMMVMMNPLINVREILTCMDIQKTLLVQFFAVAICHAKPKCKYFHQKYQNSVFFGYDQFTQLCTIGKFQDLFMHYDWVLGFVKIRKWKIPQIVWTLQHHHKSDDWQSMPDCWTFSFGKWIRLL